MLSKYLINTPWAIETESFKQVLQVIDRIDLTEKFTKRQTASGDILKSYDSGKIVSLPVVGPLSRRANLLSEISGATSIEKLEKEFLELVNDDSVKAIILDFDSPGGEVSGINNLSQLIYEARQIKPIYAYISNMAASGAYWLASACTYIYSDLTASVGSIGVILSIQDNKGKLEKEGIKEINFISSTSPLKRPDIETEAGAGIIQKRADDLANIFIEAVARNRNTEFSNIVKNYGEGFVKLATEAEKFGMIDGILSYGNFIKLVIKENSMGNINSETVESKVDGIEDLKSEIIEAEHKRQEEIILLAEKHNIPIQDYSYYLLHSNTSKTEFAEKILELKTEGKAKISASLEKTSRETEEISASNFDDLSSSMITSEDAKAIEKLNEGRK